MDSLKYVKNYAAGSKTVEMQLYDGIGVMDGVGVSGAGFASELDYLANREGVTTINVRINSPGGSVLDGLSIIGAMNRINQSGIAEVNTYIDGIAGSMGGIIAISGKKRYAFDYSRIMVHAPSDSDDKTLAQVRGLLTAILGAQTTDADIENIMSSGGDQWYTAREAKKRGYVDEIIKTGRAPIDTTKNIRAAMADATKIIKNFNSETMDLTLIRAKLNIGETENVGAAIDSLIEKAATAEANNKTLAAELDAMKNVVAESAVDAAIAAGKFDVKDRAALIGNAKAAPEAFAAIAKSTTTVANKVPIGGPGAASDNVEVSENGFAVNSKGLVSGPGIKDGGLSFEDLDKAELSAKVKAAAPTVWSKAYAIEFGKD